MTGNDLHGYFALRLFFAFLLLPFFLRFLGTGFVHQYHLQYFLLGLNASLSSQYRVPAPLLLWRHLSQSHGILFAFLMCSIEFIDVPYFPFDILKPLSFLNHKKICKNTFCRKLSIQGKLVNFSLRSIKQAVKRLLGNTVLLKIEVLLDLLLKFCDFRIIIILY